MSKFKELFSGLKGKSKGRIVKAAISLTVIVLIVGLYFITGNDGSRGKSRSDGKHRTLAFDEKTFEQTILNTTRAEVDSLRDDLTSFKKEMRDLLSTKMEELEKKERETQKRTLDLPGKISANQGFPKPTHASTLPLPVVNKVDLEAVPEPKKGPFKAREKKSKEGQGAKKDAPVRQIAVFSNPNAKDELTADSKDITVHLPPSFMEANLLNGVTAPATDVGRNNPIPMLIRVNNLAVLPNNVKSNTKGCFVVAEGYGSLADERVHTRLLTISCIDRAGGTVIDQKIKGFVVDTDGKQGMKGHVYAKFGQHIARVAIAGFLEGLGDAMSLGQQRFTYGAATGVTSSQFKDTDPDTLAKAGIGQGIVNVADDLQKFYLQLA